jgi:RecA-family ATPase
MNAEERKSFLPRNPRPDFPRNSMPRNPRPIDPGVTFGKPKPDVNPAEWRQLFHTREEIENAPDPEYLIKGFLQEESITGLIGPPRARKSIVVLNIIHALLTGERLFGHFEVTSKPERVVYLCQESGQKSLGRRVRNMGLARCIGDSLFLTSMNSEKVNLLELRLREAAKGSVLIIDTAIRFFDGDENSSEDMKAFGD